MPRKFPGCPVIPGVVLAAIGVHTVFASFFLSILTMGGRLEITASPAG